VLSLLIPVYNYDVRAFVCELSQQCETAGISFEIICLDDCSQEKFKRLNKDILNLSNVVYQELKSNQGRSAIRNLLAAKARYKFLLFLDCDQMPEAIDFIKRYISSAREGAVICGGRSYDKKPPSDASLFFHWYYGLNREVRSAADRNKFTYRSFLSNSFLVDSNTFRDIKFDEKIKSYGHEDTLFGIELMRKKVPVIHIDNPVLHVCLENCESFFKKSILALENLHYLKSLKIPELQGNVKILRWEKRVRNSGLAGLLKMLYPFIKKRTEENICSANPSLKLFDLFKLSFLLTHSDRR
jgi:glycosyltransferase involved in cell wall biosynthesis